jgi:DNA-binding transcriptional LysR family regulator
MTGRDLALTDVRLLRLFEAVLATGSISRAAEQLGLSQPTVSIGLATLRRQFDDPLFVRTSEGMQPTPQASALAGPVNEVLQSLRRLSEWHQRFDPLTSQRKFRICMTDASHITLLPRLLAHVRSAAPSVQLEATGIDPSIPRALQCGEADLALGLIPLLETGFYQQTLYLQDWICLSRADHPRVGQRLTLSAYEREDHVGIVHGTGYHLLEDALLKHGIARRIALSLPGFLGLAAILSTSDLLVTLPRHIGETLAKLGHLAIHECPFEIEGFSVKQHWHARYHHDVANRWLRGVCVELFQNPSATVVT